MSVLFSRLCRRAVDILRWLAVAMRGQSKPFDVCGLKIDDICKPGNTLVWDMVQDDNIVSV